MFVGWRHCSGAFEEERQHIAGRCSIGGIEEAAEEGLMCAIQRAGAFGTICKVCIDEVLLVTAGGEFLGAHQCADALAVVGHSCIHTERFVS